MSRLEGDLKLQLWLKWWEPSFQTEGNWSEPSVQTGRGSQTCLLVEVVGAQCPGWKGISDLTSGGSGWSPVSRLEGDLKLQLWLKWWEPSFQTEGNWSEPSVQTGRGSQTCLLVEVVGAQCPGWKVISDLTSGGSVRSPVSRLEGILDLTSSKIFGTMEVKTRAF